MHGPYIISDNPLSLSRSVYYHYINFFILKKIDIVVVCRATKKNEWTETINGPYSDWII